MYKYTYSTIWIIRQGFIYLNINFSMKTQSFVMIFFDSIEPPFNSISRIEYVVFIRLCHNLEYEGTKTVLTSHDRRDIETSLGIGKQSITNALSSLLKIGLIKGERGTYEISPLYAWRGSIKEREKALKRLRSSMLNEVANRGNTFEDGRGNVDGRPGTEDNAPEPEDSF